eukprot:928574-Pyramimonas_sp.AAC.1
MRSSDLDAPMGWRIFSGKGSAAHFARSVGMVAITFDREDDKSEDITTLVGVFYCAWIIASIVEDGLAWFSPECKTWLSFLCRGAYSREMRGWSILGQENVAKSTAANFGSVVVAWLLLL